MKSRSQDYFDALHGGQVLRTILEWVYDMGSEKYWDRLKRWMAANRMVPQDEKLVVNKK